MNKGRLVFCMSLILVLSLLSVQQNLAAVRLGYEIEKMKRARTAIRHENAALRCDLSRLVMPARVAEQLAAMEMRMVDAEGRELAGWHDPSGERFAAAGEREPQR